MSQPVFASLLADRFVDFITFRRSSGADYRGRGPGAFLFRPFPEPAGLQRLISYSRDLQSVRDLLELSQSQYAGQPIVRRAPVLLIPASV